MKRKLTILLILFLFFGCTEKQKVFENLKIDQVTVSTVKAEMEKFRPEIKLSGTFKPFREANLSANIPGRIKKIHYREGRSVSKGAVVVTLSGEMTRAAQAELDAATSVKIGS